MALPAEGEAVGRLQHEDHLLPPIAPDVSFLSKDIGGWRMDRRACQHACRTKNPPDEGSGIDEKAQGSDDDWLGVCFEMIVMSRDGRRLVGTQHADPCRNHGPMELRHVCRERPLLGNPGRRASADSPQFPAEIHSFSNLRG